MSLHPHEVTAPAPPESHHYQWLPPHVVKRCLKKTPQIPHTQTLMRSQISYVSLTCKAYVTALQDLNVKVVVQSWRTLHTIFMNRPVEERLKGVVYKVDCSCGSTYIGETVEHWMSDSRSTREQSENIRTSSQQWYSSTH